MADGVAATEIIGSEAIGLPSERGWTAGHQRLLDRVRALLFAASLPTTPRLLADSLRAVLEASRGQDPIDPLLRDHLRSCVEGLRRALEIHPPMPVVEPAEHPPGGYRLRDGQERAELRDRLLDALDHHAIVSVTDGYGTIVHVNDLFVEVSGYSREELLGSNHRMLKSGEHTPEFYHDLWRTIRAGRIWRGEIRNRCKDGSTYWVHASILPFLGADPESTRYVAIRTEITAVKELEIEALEASRAKSLFLSSMSHELRTPMNAIIGFAQVLDYDERLQEDQLESVREILRAGKHLLGLINEVLDLAQIESGKVPLSIEPVSLAELLDECRSLVMPIAEQRGIALALDPGINQGVAADRFRLKQVMLNLLSNAIKYNRDQGSVRVLVTRLPGSLLRVTVADSGFGIAPEAQGALFQPFSRLGAENTEIEGTGIGLSIARSLIELMGGRIGVDSDPGVGSRFWFELAEASVDFGQGDSRNDDTERVDGDGLGGARRLILYIEDNPVNLRLLAQILRRRPRVELLSAHEPELGIDLALAHRPDLILLDINMPRLDGYQVLARLRANSVTREIPVIALTANAMPKDIERGKRAGFDHYLTKPVDVGVLLDLIDKIAS